VVEQHVTRVWSTELRVVIYRKKVFHRTRKNYQLDLFDPDNGTYEYSAIATNLSLSPRRLWNFMAGRGEHEKVIGQLRSQLAFATVPTQRYGANSAWQQLVAIAHNLLVSFQIDTGARRRHPTETRTCLFELKTAQTLRFELLNRAGRLVRPNGATILRLSRNGRYRDLFTRTANALKAA
jgi:Transposase DDE domain group 1